MAASNGDSEMSGVGLGSCCDEFAAGTSTSPSITAQRRMVERGSLARQCTRVWKVGLRPLATAGAVVKVVPAPSGGGWYGETQQ
jgi:hypothetical protein